VLLLWIEEGFFPAVEKQRVKEAKEAREQRTRDRYDLAVVKGERKGMRMQK